jgi:hypothetical protein
MEEEMTQPMLMARLTAQHKAEQQAKRAQKAKQAKARARAKAHSRDDDDAESDGMEIDEEEENDDPHDRQPRHRRPPPPWHMPSDMILMQHGKFLPPPLVLSPDSVRAVSSDQRLYDSHAFRLTGRPFVCLFVPQ